MKLSLALTLVLGAEGSVSAAESTFQNSCSDIKLAADGTAITTLVGPELFTRHVT